MSITANIQDNYLSAPSVAAGILPAVEPGFQPGGTDGQRASNRIERTGASASPGLVRAAGCRPLRQPGWLPLRAFVCAAPRPLLGSCAEPSFHRIVLHVCHEVGALVVIPNQMVKRFGLPELLSPTMKELVGFVARVGLPTMQNL